MVDLLDQRLQLQWHVAFELLTLALFANHKPLGLLVPAAYEWTRLQPLAVLLRQRPDTALAWPQATSLQPAFSCGGFRLFHFAGTAPVPAASIDTTNSLNHTGS